MTRIKGKIVAITGGAGFIGSHLADRVLEEQPSRLIIFDDFSSGKAENLSNILGKPEVEVVKGDITDETSLHALKKARIIFHFAAIVGVDYTRENPLLCLKVNLEGVRNVLNMALNSEVERVIFSSSSEVYGTPDSMPLSETSPTGPTSVYGVSKLAAETYFRTYYKKYGLESVTLRFFNVYGPRQDPSRGFVVPNSVISVLQSKPPVIHGDGNQTRDFTYVEDAVNATVLAAQQENLCCEVFNVGTGREITIRDLSMKIMQARAANNLKAVFLPPRKVDARRRVAVIAKISRFLRCEPEYSLNEGIRKTIEYYRETWKQKEVKVL